MRLYRAKKVIADLPRSRITLSHKLLFPKVFPASRLPADYLCCKVMQRAYLNTGKTR